MMKTGLLILLAALTASIAPAQKLEFSVTNPSDVARPNEAIILQWSDIQARLPGASPARIQFDGPAAIQVDDLNGDGRPDEFVFQDDFAPREVKYYAIMPPHEVPPRIARPPCTDAADWKRIGGVLRSIDDDDVDGTARERKAYRFDGVGWESESMAYRLYLDERNAVDLLGKRKPGLYWDWIGKSGTDYQADAAWGMDILHVGNALGIGGIGIWSGDSIVKPAILKHQRTRILRRGPVRSVVRVEYTGWKAGDASVDLVSTFIMYAGERWCEHRIDGVNGGKDLLLATGIVKEDSTEFGWDPEHGWLITAGRQSRANDSLMMAIVVDPSRVVRMTEDRDQHLLVLKPSAGNDIRLFLTSYWQGETGRMWSREEIKEHLQSIVRRSGEPLIVKFTGS